MKTPRTALRSAYRPLSRYLTSIRLRAEFPGLVTEIDGRDEMFAYIYAHVPGPKYFNATREYLRSGAEMYRDLESIVAGSGRELGKVGALLEFAAGYGRLTRFLASRLPAAHVTVSDIAPGAAEFARRAFGVGGFTSTANAEDLGHARRYDVVFAASLFSHFPPPLWAAWLRRLYGLLLEGGLLIFSTHGERSYHNVWDDVIRGRLREVEPGFFFWEHNETAGRLAGGYYGTSYVTEQYVRDFVAGEGWGGVKGFHPAGLYGHQDVYVVERLDPPVVT
jgi:SAM-dependent methyltransferase